MKVALVLFMIIMINFSFAQSQTEIKEYYDQVLEPYFSSNDYQLYDDDSKTWLYAWGDMLLSYVRMYEATNDKAYINKFIKHSLIIQIRRNSTTPTWWFVIQSSVDDQGIWHSNNVLYTGRMIRPMAEFVYIIKLNASLYNTLLPEPIRVPNLPYPITTYGMYADWLLMRIKESINYINTTYWVNCSSCYVKTTNPPNTEPPIEINFSASYAVSMLLIASVDQSVSVDYYYRSRCIEGLLYKNLLLFKNDSYVWYHLNHEFYEDVGHGIFDTHILLYAYRFLPSFSFLSVDLNKLAHTFTYNIWDRENYKFNNTVWATIGGGTEEKSCGDAYSSNKDTNFYGSGEILGWMPLYKYDDADAYPNDIYTILLKQANDIISNDPNTLRTACGRDYAITGSTALFGLTEVIKAQWEKDDFSLRLFNRNLNYDQDFCAKKKLVVEPEATIENNYNTSIKQEGSFSDPSFKEKKFIVRSGTTVNMTAGESITFLPGTVIEAGSNFSASIEPGGCPEKKASKSEDNATLFSDEELDSLMKEVAVLIKQDSIQMAQFDSTATYNPIVTSPSKQEPTKQEEALFLPFAVFPNPIQSSIAITAPIKETTEIQIRLYDYTGRIIMDIQKPYNPYMQIETEAVSSGLYFLHLNSGDNEYREVLIKK